MKKLLLATALCALALPAYAGSLTYDQYTFTGLGSIHITSPNDITGGAGPITLYEKGVVVVADAWCLDVDNFLAGGATVGTLPFTLTNADSGLPGVPTNLSATQLGVIGWLVDIGDHTSDATLQGAVQVAIWSEEYGNAFTYDPISGAFTTDVANDLSTAQADYTGHGLAPLSLTLLVPGAGASSQTLVFGSAIPEPSTWAMMGVGFALMGLFGWRKRTARYAI
jgi:hypothetical protein